MRVLWFFKYLVLFCVLSYIALGMCLVAVFSHDLQVLFHFGATKQETRDLGEAVVAKLNSYREQAGIFPARLEDLADLPRDERIALQYSVGDSRELFVLKLSSGPHEWCYYEMWEAWDYLPDSHSSD